QPATQASARRGRAMIEHNPWVRTNHARRDARLPGAVPRPRRPNDRLHLDNKSRPVFVLRTKPRADRTPPFVAGRVEVLNEAAPRLFPLLQTQGLDVCVYRVESRYLRLRLT